MNLTCAKIRKLMKQALENTGIKNINKDSILYMDKVITLFVQNTIQQTAKKTIENKRKTIREEEIICVLDSLDLVLKIYPKISDIKKDVEIKQAG